MKSEITKLIKNSELLCNLYQNRCTECMNDDDCPDCGEVNFTFYFSLTLNNWYKVNFTLTFLFSVTLNDRLKVNFTFTFHFWLARNNWHKVNFTLTLHFSTNFKYLRKINYTFPFPLFQISVGSWIHSHFHFRQIK